MASWLERTELILGKTEMDRLKSAHVMIVCLGGIGSFAGEFIARSGIGTITLIDGDVFDPSNKNRQLTALDSTIGRNKAVVLAERIREINPDVALNVVEESQPDYVMDCIDSLAPKLEWIIAAKRLRIKIISHLGAGGKTDPSRVQVTNLPNSHNCQLAHHVKKRLKKKNVEFKNVRCVFSSELQQKES